MERVDCNTVATVTEQVVTLAGPGTLFQAFHLVCNTSSSNRGLTVLSPEVVRSGTSSHMSAPDGSAEPYGCCLNPHLNERIKSMYGIE